MKIVFLSTGSGLRPEYINALRARLDLHDSDVVCLLSWLPPRRPLPVNRHLVIGPHLRVRGELATVQRVQRRPDLFPAAAPQAPPAAPELPAAEQLPAATQRASDAAGAHARAASATAQLPVLHPRRMRKALAWRVRRLKRAARTQASSGLTGVRTHPKFRKVRNRLSPGVSLGFAAGCLRAGKVHEMIRDADLVVALDAASHRGAWTLAQKVPGPHVVIGVPSAKRLLELRETSNPG